MTLVEQDLRGHLADAQGFVDALAAAHQKGDALEDYAVQLNAGAAETLSYWSTPVADGAPSVRRVEHFYRAAQRAAIPLPPGQEGWTDIVAAVPDMVFTADPEGRITWCNPAAPSLAGYGAGEFQSLPLANLAAAEARQQVQELVQKALGQAGRMQKQEVLMARGDGQRYWGELALVSAPGQEATQAPVLHGMLRNITERKIAAAIRDILTGQRPV
jgi:PAS domain S-box-containing protein